MTFARTMLASLVAAALVCAPVSACSTCFGDPDSSMVKGAVMGVYVLVGIVSFVLAGIAGTGLFWIHRSRIIAAQESSQVGDCGKSASVRLSANPADEFSPRRGDRM